MKQTVTIYNIFYVFYTANLTKSNEENKIFYCSRLNRNSGNCDLILGINNVRHDKFDFTYLYIFSLSKVLESLIIQSTIAEEQNACGIPAVHTAPI